MKILKTPHTYFATKITLLALTLTAMMTTTPLYADNSNNFTKDTITCTTELVCKELTQFIQAQIDELEAKDDLSNDDKRLRYNLKKQLIVVEKSETKINSNLIATEKSETVQKLDTRGENSKLIDAKLQDQDAQIAVLRGALLEN